MRRTLSSERTRAASKERPPDEAVADVADASTVPTSEVVESVVLGKAHILGVVSIFFEYGEVDLLRRELCSRELSDDPAPGQDQDAVAQPGELLRVAGRDEHAQ